MEQTSVQYMANPELYLIYFLHTMDVRVRELLRGFPLFPSLLVAETMFLCCGGSLSFPLPLLPSFPSPSFPLPLTRVALCPLSTWVVCLVL